MEQIKGYYNLTQNLINTDMTTSQAIQHRVADYVEGIQNYPKNFNTTLKGIKAWRKIKACSNDGKLPSHKVNETFMEFTTMISNMLAYNKLGRERTLEFVTTLDKQLAADNIEI